MERIKQMNLKKALFTISLISITIASVLSLFMIWLCAELRSHISPAGISIRIGFPDPSPITQAQEASSRAVLIYEMISIAQLLIPVLLYILALTATASGFYRLKLKDPLAVLTRGAACIIDNNLDFSIEKKSQDELGQLCTAFETMRRALLNNNRELWRQAEERKRLNAAFSHNLRNPVTVLKGSVKLARKCVENSAGNTTQLTDNLSRIESYTDRIERYVETMSSIQKLEDITIQRELTRWDRLTSELKNLICFVDPDHQKQIQFTAAGYFNNILIDKSVLFQITENLVSNALRFAASGIDIFCCITDGKLSVSVTDDGCGFPDKLMKNGIQPFQKGKEDHRHFGMGLYTCQLLCKKHGGDITLENRPAGATVTATLTIEQNLRDF